MAHDLCKKHSFGYEPLKVIGLNVAGKDCLLCLAEENAELQAENKRLKAMYKAAKGDLEDVMRGDEGAVELINELQAENELLSERIEIAAEYLPECPDKALSFLKPALTGDK